MAVEEGRRLTQYDDIGHARSVELDRLEAEHRNLQAALRSTPWRQWGLAGSGGMTVLSLGLEVHNLQQLLNDNNAKGDINELIKFVGGLAGLVGGMLDLARLGRDGLYLLGIGSGQAAGGGAVARLVGSRLAGRLNVAASLSSLYTSYTDSVAAASAYDMRLAVLHGVVFVGTLVGLVGLMVGGLVVGPIIAVASLLIVVGAALLMPYFRDSQEEYWLKHGPWGKRGNDNSEVVQAWDQDLNKVLKAWENLMNPVSVAVAAGRHYVTAEVVGISDAKPTLMVRPALSAWRDNMVRRFGAFAQPLEVPQENGDPAAGDARAQALSTILKDADWLPLPDRQGYKLVVPTPDFEPLRRYYRQAIRAFHGAEAYDELPGVDFYVCVKRDGEEVAGAEVTVS
ncbi:hypothetical protein CAI21_08550 [Alkalilimnicola ehrlichii]|uniref:Uncharacterized protein n=1 Tax=Alkalilimnicola ehrlichii TaxID=351052 RepID=A0A3E0WWA1_9GAMM|nr:hypothetical protein [Alkalilimnicola ehrlichii]RFA29874.1 hypothetical protein CAI21_08550 [Alkalilimnicola ehrlichii]RFA36463.1 hypothetical protein CAL65_10820 [Alkalilimnicola ehrlichii]